jgi:hypothetical protein
MIMLIAAIVIALVVYRFLPELFMLLILGGAALAFLTTLAVLTH